MSVALIGGLAGLVIGIASLVFSRMLAGRVDLPETRQALRISGIIQLIFFPVAGWFIAPLLFGD
jgi:hypothetical protein